MAKADDLADFCRVLDERDDPHFRLAAGAAVGGAASLMVAVSLIALLEINAIIYPFRMSDEGTSRGFGRQCLLSSVIIVLVAAVPNLVNSFWLDELQTYWVIRDSLADTCKRAFETQGFSPFYYLLIRPLLIFGKPDEFVLRLPSLFFMLLSARYVYLLAAYLINGKAAWISTVLFIAGDSTIEASVTARPYALAMLGSVAAMYYFIKWFDGHKIKDAILFVLWFGISIASQVMFGAALLIQLLYFLLHIDRKPSVKACAAVLAAVAAEILLVMPQTLLMLSKKDLMAIAPMPGLPTLLLDWIPPVTLVMVAVAYILAASFKSINEPQALQREERKTFLALYPFLLGWHLVPPLLIFLLSHLLGTSIYVPRYFLWTSPALCILAGSLVSFKMSHKQQTTFVFVCLILSVIFFSQRERSSEDWRTAVIELAAQQGTETPGTIFLYSGIVESANDEWLEDPIKSGQFTSPLSYYPPPPGAKIVPLPLFVTKEADSWSRWIEPHSAPDVFLLALNNLSWSEDGKRVSVTEKLEALFTAHNYSVRSHKAFARVHLMRLQAVDRGGGAGDARDQPLAKLSS